MSNLVKIDADVKELVNATLEAALVQVLGKGEALVKELVRHALSKTTDRYSSKTILEEVLDGAIRRIAVERIKVWAAGHAGEIAAMVDVEIGKKLTVETVAKNVAKAMEKTEVTIKIFSPAIDMEDDE